LRLHPASKALLQQFLRQPQLGELCTIRLVKDKLKILIVVLAVAVVVVVVVAAAGRHIAALWHPQAHKSC